MTLASGTGRSVGWVGRARPIPATDPLRLGQDGLTFYWELPQEGEACAGFGVAAELLSVHSASSLLEAERAQVTWQTEVPHAPGPWWGGVAFDPSRSPERRWADFGSARWVLPEVACVTRAGRSWLCAFVGEGSAQDVGALLEARLDALQKRLEAAELVPAPRQVATAPGVEQGREDFTRLVREALSSIEVGALSKVVAARPVEVRLPSPVDASQVVATLREAHPTCAVFVMGTPGGAYFLGATPETLLRASEGRLHTEALAGTLPAEATLASADDKLRREHQAVVDAVTQTLRPRVVELDVDPEPSLVRLPRLSHLRTGVRAQLRPGTSLAELALALHPTPAVAGTPTRAAVAFLRAHEGFDRGWYAGFVGWMGAGAAHLRVALRSAWVQGTAARAYAGAGIVAGSEPDAEWAETAVKVSAVLDALGGAHGGR